MPGRWGWRVLIAAVVVGASVGCRTIALPKDKNQEPISQLVPPADGAAESNDKDLPPDEAARVCVSTAAEMEKNGDEMSALILYEKARKYDPKCKVNRQLAVLYDRMGDFQKAQDEYQLALKQTPHDADLLNDMGYGYYSRGRWAEAEKYLRQALVAKPKHPRATINLGLCLGEQGRHAEALELFEKVVTPAQARCNLAFILTTQHKWSEARRIYVEALKLDPDIPLARAALAKLDKAERQPSKDEQTAQAPAKSEGNSTVGSIQFDDSEDKPVLQQAAHWMPAAQASSSSPSGESWHPVALP